jgi:hypothetical protein
MKRLLCTPARLIRQLVQNTARHIIRSIVLILEPAPTKLTPTARVRAKKLTTASMETPASKQVGAWASSRTRLRVKANALSRAATGTSRLRSAPPGRTSSTTPAAHTGVLTAAIAATILAAAPMLHVTYRAQGGQRNDHRCVSPRQQSDWHGTELTGEPNGPERLTPRQKQFDWHSAEHTWAAN